MTCTDPEGGGGRKITKLKGSLNSNTDPDLLENHKSYQGLKPAFNVGQSSARQQHAIYGRAATIQ